MKSNGNGYRLVQRKFAQGVPIPQSSGAPPPPPKREQEPPPKEDPAIYQSKMSAKCLLDIVALQNVHRHKQPMVVVERLRVNEIPMDTARKKTKSTNKNQMCLRPKRKSAQAVKQEPAKKRVCRGRQSLSGTDDDVPLFYLANQPKTQDPAKGPVTNGDQKFTFKRPSKAVVLKYRTRKTKKNISPTSGDSSPVSSTSTGGQTRRNLRSSQPAAPTRRVAKQRPRKQPAKSKKMPKQEPSAELPISADTVGSTTNGNSRPADNQQPTVSAQRMTRHRTNSNWSISTVFSLRGAEGCIQSATNINLNSQATANQLPNCQGNDTIHRLTKSIIAVSNGAAATDVDNVPPTPPTPCPSESYSSVQEVVNAANSRCSSLQRRCRKCSKCVIVNKIIELIRILNPLCQNPANVYDFNNELEESMCESPTCLRDNRRATRNNSEEENNLYLDILPKNNPNIVQIARRRTAERTIRTAASLVNRDAVPTAAQPSLVEHENLLDQLMKCLDRQNQAQAQASATATPDEPQPSTSRDTVSADVQRAAQILASLGMTKTEPAPDQEPDYASDATSVGEPESTMGEYLNINQSSGQVLEAPTFYPTKEEFMDPIEYYKKIEPLASKFGLCKIVAPDSFRPPCYMSDNIRFAVIYQYISKLYNRWGPVSRELAAIKAHLRTQSVVFARSPLLDGSEVNLPKLYHSVERNGGPTKVIQRKRWGRVAEDMRLTKLQNPERKLDQIYMRYLLPYATLSSQERQDTMAEVEQYWAMKYKRMLFRARNPFHRQKRMIEDTESSEDECIDVDAIGALQEAEDCIVQGRTMNISTFKKIATSLMEAHFDGVSVPSAEAVEKAYWRTVLLGTEHIVANTASIDTGEEGYGFPKDPDVEYGEHPFNLKMLAKNPNNVLRFLGPVLGVTVPTLHLSMLFSTSCWHRDPHGLPWTEFMHSGPEKIWYGIPSSQSTNFRRAVETLCPAYCQNKSIWLASDIAMIPPEILSEHNVTLSRLTQRPGEYVMVFPEAHTCSIATGYCISESVYFATDSWLETVYKLFQELRNSCEPTMFSLEQLLINGANDENAPRRVLLPMCSMLGTLVSAELEHRRVLELKGIEVQEISDEEPQARVWNARDQEECEFCRCSLFLSKVTGLTSRKTAVCPEHAIHLLEMRKYKNFDVSTLVFMSSFPTSMLDEMLDKMEKRDV